MAVTIRDVAREAGVSIATVSHALSGNRTVSQETERRVRASAARLGYRPNHVAASMVTGRTRTIGVIVPDIANPFFSELVRAAERAAALRDHVLIVSSSELDAGLEDRSLEVMFDKRADAILYAPGTPRRHASLRRIVASGAPVVVLDEAIASLPRSASVITTDSEGGARLAALHLGGLGHRRVGVIAGPKGLPTARTRLEGFLRGAAEAGFRVPPNMIVSAAAYTREEGLEVAISLLSSRAVTAVFCANDLIALGALQAAADLGISVPDDLSVVGFDDIFVSKLVSPALTTIRQPIGLLGKEAANLAIDLIEGVTALPQRRVLDVELVVRASSAPVLTRRAKGSRHRGRANVAR
jgi:LacI family transcriptional regulator